MAGRRIIAIVLAGIMMAALSLPLSGYTEKPAGVQVMLGLEEGTQGQPELADAQQIIKEIQARFEAIGMSPPEAEQQGSRLIRITLPDAGNTHQLEEVVGILAFEFKEKYEDETVFTGGDIAEVLLQLDPVSGKPVVHVRFHTGQATPAGMQKKSLAVYVTDYSSMTHTLKLAEPGEYTIEGFKDIAEARRVAALLYNASHPLNVKILDSVRQTGATGSGAAAAGAVVAKHPFLDRADRYAAFYNPFRCRELFDLFNLIKFSPGKNAKMSAVFPNAGQQIGLMTRLRYYVEGDDIHGTLSGSRILSLLK